MENKFIVNIIHRPELSPEYAEKALGGAKGVRDESLDIFRFQQDTAEAKDLRKDFAFAPRPRLSSASITRT